MQTQTYQLVVPGVDKCNKQTMTRSRSPSLSVSSEALSSCSTCSSAVDSEETFYTTNTLTGLRPLLKCRCENCQKTWKSYTEQNPKAPRFKHVTYAATKEQWLNCNRVTFVEAGFELTLTGRKKTVKANGKDLRVSEATVQLPGERRTVTGWVPRRHLQKQKRPRCTVEAESFWTTNKPTGLRPYLTCFCKFCTEEWQSFKAFMGEAQNSNVSYVGEYDWSECLRVKEIEEGVTLRFQGQQRVVKANGERIAVIKAVAQLGDKEVSGWIPISHLERKTRVPTATVKHRFQRREVVLCRGGLGQEWTRGVVAERNPLSIMVDGATEVSTFDVRNVKRHPTTTHVTLKELTVSKYENCPDIVHHKLKKGTKIKVAFFRGDEARINAPFKGWVVFKTKHNLNILEEGYTFKQCEPTVTAMNVCAEEDAWLKQVVRGSWSVSPSRVLYQQKGARTRAVLTFKSHQDAFKLVEAGNITFPNNFVLQFSWEANYLRSCAWGEDMLE